MSFRTLAGVVWACHRHAGYGIGARDHVHKRRNGNAMPDIPGPSGSLYALVAFGTELPPAVTRPEGMLLDALIDAQCFAIDTVTACRPCYRCSTTKVGAGDDLDAALTRSTHQM